MISSINEAMDLIHSDISYLMLVITDAAAYNLKANIKIKETRKDLIWSTFNCHLLHNVMKKLDLIMIYLQNLF